MLVDFAEYHARHLVSRKAGDQWLYDPVNPRNPHNGKHVASRQIFSNNALGVALYVRNQLDSEFRAVGVFTALKLSFSRKVEGTYLLNKDEKHLSLALDIHGVRQLYTWVQGIQQTFRSEIVKPGTPPKSITGYRMQSGQFPHSLKAIGHTSSGEQAIIDVGLSDGDLFTLAMYCIGYCKLLYPSIDGAVIERLLAIPQIAAARGEGGGTEEKFVHAQTSDSHADIPETVSPPRSSVEQMELERRPDEMIPTTLMLRAQKAIFAIGMQKWPKKNRAAIEYIQDVATHAAMDRLIKAANTGDFTEWDKIAEPFL